MRSRLIGAFIVLLAAGCLHLGAWAEEDPAAAGEREFYSGKYEAAIKLLEKAVSEAPDEVRPRVFIAKAYLQLGKTEKAKAELEKVLELAPKHVEGAVLLGGIQFKAGAWEEAVKLLEPLAAVKHDYEVFVMLAEAFVHLGEPSKSLKYYREAVRLNDQSPYDRFYLGNVLLDMGKFSEAAEEYERAIELGLDDAVLRYKLAIAYYNLRNYTGRTVKRKVEGRKPGDLAEEWYLLREVAGRRGEFYCAPEKSAAYQAARAIDMGLNLPEIKLLLGNTFFGAGYYKEAAAIYATLRGKLQEADEAAMEFHWSQASLKLEDYDGFIGHLKKAIEIDKERYGSELADAYHTLAREYEKAGDLEKQIESLRSAVAEAPTTADYHYELGKAYMSKGMNAEALAQFRMTLTLEPEHPRQLEMLNATRKIERGLSEAKED